MKNILKAFFCNSDWKFQPIYFWATIFLAVTFSMVIMRMVNDTSKLSDQLILGMMAGVIGLITIYTWNNKRLDKFKENTDNCVKKDGFPDHLKNL